MIRTGIDALRSAQLDFLVSDATYRRGAEARSVKAVVGRTVFRSMTEYGAWVRTETRDFIIPAGQLDLERPLPKGDKGAYEVHGRRSMSAETEKAHGAGMPPGFPELWESVTRARMDIAELKGMVKMHFSDTPPCATATGLQKTLHAAMGAAIISLLSAVGTLIFELVRYAHG